MILFFLTVRAKNKEKTGVTEEPKKQKQVISDENRHKPYGRTAWVPVDDVYILRYYPRTIYDAGEAIDMLKNFQKLDFTPPEQHVYIDLRLDMKLEKKVFTFSFCPVWDSFFPCPSCALLDFSDETGGKSLLTFSRFAQSEAVVFV